LTTDASLAAIAAAGQTPAAEAAGFPFTNIPPDISFLTKNVPPPATAYVGRQDQISLGVCNAIPDNVVTMEIRTLTPSGELKQHRWDFHPPSDRSTQWYERPLAEGFLLTISVYTDSAAPPGGCYVGVYLVSGVGGIPPTAQTFGAGYVGSVNPLMWPYPRVVNPGEGPGRLRMIIGTNPAPGNAVLETVPTGARWKLTSLRCGLSTNTTAVTRYACLFLQDAPGIFVYLPSQAGQPQSSLYNYTWAIGTQATPSMAIPNIINPLPDQIHLDAGQQFGLIAYSGTANDDWGAPLYCVEEWVMP
jgi:hypothetical protein